MFSLIKKIHKIIDIRYKALILPIILSCFDSLLHMTMFGIMVQTLIKLTNNTFSSNYLFKYSILLLIIFIIRAVTSSINYTQVQYRGADITSFLHLSTGNHIRSLNLGYFKKNIAIVFQDVYLLNDTIYNNIKIGKPYATFEEVEAAAKSAQCHDFICELENGYDTIVGEGGSTLSGGEKQRISIARALIKDAPIVLLDESTSSLDADNESEINKALDILMKNKTVIVIAHRLNTIINADNIIVLDKGIIKEQGNHKKLLKLGGWYANMIEEQEKACNWSIK
ncbi:ABC transporter ATP-binding protein [Fusobacterium sp. PH5-44]|uniref:ABC transporter ATP-binding protein n=1 Tax=unclassified Fusobacterium TaxID=2648384 RepID=UPI003D1CDA33